VNSFLILADQSLHINEIIWSDPAYFVTKKNRSLLDLFAPQETDKLHQILKESNTQDRIYQCADALSLIGHASKVKLCVLRAEDLYLLFAVDEAFAASAACSQEFVSIVHKFMTTVRGYLRRMVFHSDTSSRELFEKIQTLNNELMNTGRMLEKANVTLHDLNKDLNNRLVKDALTGLVSRYQYRTEIEMLIAQNPGRLGIFAYIDIDDFKKVNDTYGHAVGDTYLTEFAGRLKQIPTEKMIRMRIAGDEFGLFLYGLDRVEDSDLKNMWLLIQQYVATGPIVAGDRQIPLTVSAGLSVYGKDTTEIYDLIEYADFAMYHAKLDGKNDFRIFSRAQYDLKKGMHYENGSRPSNIRI
jgi:diguanylate cyclase (GGDEF)-like protein